jgi:hypothetical protein
MMFNAENWPYKWFGMWREYGEHYKKYPSVHDFTDAARNATYDKEQLLKYLRNGYKLVATSRINFPNPVTGEIVGGSICYSTDGKWLWFDDLADYVENNHVVIPDEWYRDIQNNNFIVPEVDGQHVEATLDWPKLD